MKKLSAATTVCIIALAIALLVPDSGIAIYGDKTFKTPIPKGDNVTVALIKGKVKGSKKLQKIKVEKKGSLPPTVKVISAVEKQGAKFAADVAVFNPGGGDEGGFVATWVI